MTKCKNCKQKIERPAYINGKAVCQRCWHKIKYTKTIKRRLLRRLELKK